MGRVYEADHVDIGRRVALKILHASFSTAADMVERFRREARAASKIGHPNIVDVTDSGTTPDGAFYFVMEYLDGTNLEELIERDGALPVERALLIAAQIRARWRRRTRADIIHRDLKPANVMLVNREGRGRLRQGAGLRHLEGPGPGGRATARWRLTQPGRRRSARRSTCRPSRRRASRRTR